MEADVLGSEPLPELNRAKKQSQCAAKQVQNHPHLVMKKAITKKLTAEAREVNRHIGQEEINRKGKQRKPKNEAEDVFGELYHGRNCVRFGDFKDGIQIMTISTMNSGMKE